MLNKFRQKIIDILHSGSAQNERPYLDKNNQSNIPGLYIIGDLAGAPVIKYAMAQGHDVIEHIAKEWRAASADDGKFYDVIVIGAGAAGLNAALQAASHGMRYLVLEKSKIANTIENFPEGKWVYAEPDSEPPKGKLWLDGAAKEDLIANWHSIVEENQLNIHVEEGLTRLTREKGIFILETTKESVYRTKWVVLATGQRGNPRRLGIPGEEQEYVYHRLYSPRKYQDEEILVVGGGNSAVEAAVTLGERNKVYLSYRAEQFSRIFKDNTDRLQESIAAGKVEPLLKSQVKSFNERGATLEVGDDGEREVRDLHIDHAFVLIGADVPRQFLHSLGIRMENEWHGSLMRAVLLVFLGLLGLSVFGVQFGGSGTFFSQNLTFLPGWSGAVLWLVSLVALVQFGRKGDRFAWFGLSFFVWYTIYGAKLGTGQEFWPYRDWGYRFLSFFERPWSFWYTVLYTGLMTLFGLQALKRWGLDRRDRYQIWRFVSLISFQWIFFFLVPEFLFQYAVKYRWVGEMLASDPVFADQAWRSYGIVYAWPLFFYTFFYNPHQIWIVWGVLLTFVVIPVFVLFNGKRYCSWICGCGGLAETFGDRWRHLAPKGPRSVRWEWMNLAVLVIATLVTLLVLIKDIFALHQTADLSIAFYRIVADVWLVGIVPVTLYPFLGGKVWCRYWCPLAKLMQLQAKWFVKLRIGRFRIVANDKCIGCYECSRNCQVGIDVMGYALKQDVLDNETSSCIGCGICVTVCPMDTLSYGKPLDLPVNGRIKVAGDPV